MIGTNNIDLNAPDEIAAGVTAICAEFHRPLALNAASCCSASFRAASIPTPRAQRSRPSTSGSPGWTAETRWPILDISRVFVEADGSISNAVMYDFLHPTALGYQKWAAAMGPALDRLMKP